MMGPAARADRMATGRCWGEFRVRQFREETGRAVCIRSFLVVIWERIQVRYMPNGARSPSEVATSEQWKVSRPVSRRNARVAQSVFYQRSRRCREYLEDGFADLCRGQPAHPQVQV